MDTGVVVVQRELHVNFSRLMMRGEAGFESLAGCNRPYELDWMTTPLIYFFHVV